MFKIWNTGSIIYNNNYEETKTIEAPAGNDINNQITLQRGMRNLHQNTLEQNILLKQLIKYIKVNDNGLRVIDNFDFEPIISNNSNIVSIPKGIFIFNDLILIQFPQTHLGERFLEHIFNLVTWSVEDAKEYVKIIYDENGKYSATIKLYNTPEKIFNNLGAFYNTAYDLIYDINEDISFTDSITNSGRTLKEIAYIIEPTYELDGVSEYNVGITINNEIEISTSSIEYILFTYKTSIETDNRKYLKPYNNFINELKIYHESNLNDQTPAEISYSSNNNQVTINKALNVNGLVTSDNRLILNNRVSGNGSKFFPLNQVSNELNLFQDSIIIYENSIYLLEYNTDYKITYTESTTSWSLEGINEYTFEETKEYTFLIFKGIKTGNYETI